MQNMSDTIFGKFKQKCIVFMSVLLVANIILTSCILSDSNMSRFTYDGNDDLEKIEPLDASNLMRLISICLLDSSQIDSVYDSIPQEQLEGMSLSVFRLYIEVIMKMGADRGELQSFQILSGQDSVDILYNIMLRAPEESELIARSVPVILVYSEDTYQNPVLFYFQENDQGIPYLSKAWVDYCLNLFNFSAHYFTAVTTHNIDAVLSLISDSFLDMPYILSEETILLKVRQIARYYLLHVKSEFDQYSIRTLDISEIIFEQPNILIEEFDESQSRFVRFFYNQRGSISVDDRIENAIYVRDLYLYFQGNRTVRIGDRVTQSHFDSLFGPPRITTIGREAGSIYDEQGESREVRRVYVDYDALTFMIIGQINESGEWDGFIVKISIIGQSNEFSLGRVVSIGMSRDAFMSVYPFADQTEYRLFKQMDEQNFELEVIFSGGTSDHISEIHLEWYDRDLGQHLE